ncbi:MAG: NAD-binding protein [Nitriliruptorales bacterium]|nr:NAD-binding protein [Nitriliruptorales bacterium]
MSETVGIVGLGQMGSAMAAQLLQAGFAVTGYDVVGEKCEDLAARGGASVASPQAVAEAASRVITSLPSAAALDDVLQGPDGLLAASRRPLTVIETSTLSLDDKERNHQAAEQAGAILLDCPLSGTGAQARNKDLVVYASGDSGAIRDCVPVFEGFSRVHHDLGPFGTGSKMKYLANLLVAIHNVAAAEAMVLGMKAGLDPAQVYEVISSGAGTSRMFEVRGPQMVKGEYEASGIAGRVFQKDLRIIGDFASSMDCPVSLFSLSSQIHLSAVAQGMDDQDTASVCAVLERQAGVNRSTLPRAEAS